MSRSEKTREEVWLAFASSLAAAAYARMPYHELAIMAMNGQVPPSIPITVTAVANALADQWERQFGEAKYMLDGIRTCRQCGKDIAAGAHYSATDGSDGEFKKFCSEVCQDGFYSNGPTGVAGSDSAADERTGNDHGGRPEPEGEPT